MTQRYFLIAVIALCLALSAPIRLRAAGSLVSHLEEGLGVNGGTSSSIDTSGANLLVVTATWGGITPPTLSDSKSNTWTQIESGEDYGGGHVTTFYAAGGSVGSGHTFTLSGSGIYASVLVQAWSGAAGSPLDQHTKNSGLGATSVSTGSVTPTDNNQVVIASVVTEGTSVSINGGFTAFTVAQNPGVSYGGGMAYLIQTTATAANPTWSWSGFSDTNAAIATFKTSGGGGATPCLRALLGVGCEAR